MPRCAIGCGRRRCTTRRRSTSGSQSMPSGPFHWAHVAHDAAAPLADQRRLRLLRRCARRLRAGRASAPRAGAARRPPRRRRSRDGDGTHRAAVHWHCDPRWAVDARRVAGHAGGATATQGRAQRAARPARTLRRRCGRAGSGGTRRCTAALEPDHDAARQPQRRRAVLDGQPSSVSNPRTRSRRVDIGAGVGRSRRGRRSRDGRADRARAHRSTIVLVRRAGGRRRRGAAATWRVGEIETDARMLFCRVDAAARAIALVDGSIVDRCVDGLALPRVPDLHADLADSCAALGDASSRGRILGAPSASHTSAGGAAVCHGARGFHQRCCGIARLEVRMCGIAGFVVGRSTARRRRRSRALRPPDVRRDPPPRAGRRGRAGSMRASRSACAA